MASTTEKLINVIDLTSLSVRTISNEFSEINNSKHFFGKSFVDFDGGADETQYFMFRTPNTDMRIHAKASFYANVEFEIYIFEDATVSDDGVDFPTYNNNRDSSNGNQLKAFAAPTVTDEGTRIWSAKTGSRRASTGVSPGFNYEIVAKTSTVYVFKIVKKEVTIGYIDVDFWWFENEE